jgi:condensin complex subunit 2
MMVGGTAVTPMKRVPILANFEEWMKMATDNKINAANSWNFALIDYFHDMSLLKEGDGVNFQKASCTLDGCVKIYTSRVDSVATETGKLLSGLADSGNSKKKRGENEEGEESEEEEVEDEDGVVRKKPKKKVSNDSFQYLEFASVCLILARVGCYEKVSRAERSPMNTEPSRKGSSSLDCRFPTEEALKLR